MQYDDFEVCTECGDEGFVCVVGNGDVEDGFHGPFVVCDLHYKMYEEGSYEPGIS